MHGSIAVCHSFAMDLLRAEMDLIPVSKNIYVPDLASYIMNDSLIGPNQFINIYPPENETFGVLCNDTRTPSVEFSVEINGKLALPLTPGTSADITGI
jgi:hypothetical protein